MEQSLEEKFREEYSKFYSIADEKLRQAKKLLSEVIELSKQTGIPFESSISYFHNYYVPESLEKTWHLKDEWNIPDEDGIISFEEFIQYETNVYPDRYYSGWQRSSC